MSTTAVDGGFAEMALLVRSFQLARMAQVAASLGLADRVVDGPRSVTALASECDADAGMLLRLCRALAAFGIFRVDEDGQVSQTDRSAWLRQDALPTLYHVARHWGSGHMWGSWANLEHTIRTGECAFDAVYGVPLFEYLLAHPDDFELLNLFMQHSPDDRHGAVAAAYDFSDAVVVDVGGGNGALLAAILHTYASARGVLLDHDTVVADAHRVLDGAAVAARVELVAGDFFEAVPPGGDIYVLSQILHDWDDERCATILSNCRTAMRPSVRLLVVERLLEQDPAHIVPMNYLADITMMVQLHGRERTPAEYARLLTGSGFSEPRILRTTSPFCIVEATAV